MTIVKWSPISEFENIRKDLDGLFGEFFEPVTRRCSGSKRLESGIIVPHIDMLDRKGEIVVKADLPGLEKENIDLTITKDTLTIKGEVKEQEEVKEGDYYSLERSYGSFCRLIALPAEIDNSKVKATYKKGVLEITLPKTEEAKPKEIKVEIS